MFNFLFNVAKLYDLQVPTLPDVSAGPERVQVILTVTFTVLGAIALLFMTIGGFRYIASQGDPKAIGQAKSTILYSLIGLIVAICAVALVTFLLEII